MTKSLSESEQKPSPIVYDGGGIRGVCVECGCVYEEYSCKPGECLFEENEDEHERGSP